MKPFALTISLCLVFSARGAARQSTPDSPATKEDIQKYLEVTQAHDMMKQLMDVMSKQARQMVHQQIAKDIDKLPPDFEARMNKMTDDELKDFPVEEMLQAMIPVYQKHWTKGDVDAMVAFYSTPTGQKVLRQLPATVAEGMQAMQPIIQKKMNGMMERVQQEVAQVVKDSKAKAGQNSPATPN
jgi:uncharacterized protein